MTTATAASDETDDEDHPRKSETAYESRRSEAQSLPAAAHIRDPDPHTQSIGLEREPINVPPRRAVPGRGTALACPVGSNDLPLP